MSGPDLRGTPVEAADGAQFTALYSRLFEHSPWVAERAWEYRPFADGEALHAALMRVLNEAGADERLGLLLAHPELADKTAIAAGLTEDSAAEQSSAGLDRLNPVEFDEFHGLNRAYRERFGFPFIICVKRHDKASILAAMRRRLDSGREAELDEALAQVGLISRFRLADLLPEKSRAALAEAARRDLQMLDPAPNWVRPRTGPAGEAVLDVAIVGGGQSGLGCAFALRLQGVRNVLVLDENPEGLEGPWITYARMITLRTPKALTGLDMGVPSLTFRAWWEAQYGADAWMRLDKISRQDWMRYLRWYRNTLDLPVRNNARVGLVEPIDGGLHRLTLEPGGERLLARKVVFATGIQGGGEWHTPAFIRDQLSRELYAHTSQPIDFTALKGRRIGVLGGGASAFDNAQHALAAGVGEVHLFMRRATTPRVNPIRHMEASGLIRNFPALDDAGKYAVIDHFLTHAQPPTNDTFNRAAAHPGFQLHLGAPWLSVAPTTQGIAVTTPKGMFTFDFLILSTGVVTDLALRPELAAVVGDIRLWRDQYAPPPGRANPLLDLHPYLGPAFEFLGRTAQGASRVHGLYDFNYSALASLGLSAAALSGLKAALPRLAAGVAAQLFLDDQKDLLNAFLSYDEPEFVGQWPAN